MTEFSYLHSFYSNQIELLYERLKKNIFYEDKHPLHCPLILVSSPFMKKWLLERLANDSEIQLGGGVQISYLKEGVLQLLDKKKEKKYLPNKKEEILKLFHFCKDKIEKEPSFHPFFENIALLKDSEEKILRFTKELVYSLHDIEEYSPETIFEWENNEKKTSYSLQKWAFEILYKKENTLDWEPLSKKIETFYEKDLSSIFLPHTHLFGIPFIPELFLNFFIKFSQVNPLYIYLLTPSSHFWIDFPSQFEEKALLRNLSLEKTEYVQSFLTDKNPLLANFGKLSKKIFQKILDEPSLSFEDYGVISEIEEHPSYKEHLHFPPILLKEPFSLLTALQSDLLLLRNKEEPLSFFEPVPTLQIHEAMDKKREISALKDSLLRIIEKEQENNTPCKCEDILVVAPHIEAYAPYIESIFGTEEPLLPFSIFKKKFEDETSLFAGFFTLMSFPSERWSKNYLFKIFQNPFFKYKTLFNEEEKKFLKKWIKTSSVFWGINRNHQEDVLKKTYEISPWQPLSNQGTWQEMEKLIFHSFLFFPKKEGTLLPFENSGYSLYNRWIIFFNELKEHFLPIEKGEKKTFLEWQSFFKKILKTFFNEDLDEDSFKEFLHFLTAPLEIEPLLEKEVFSFEAALSLIQDDLKKSTSYREKTKGGIRFASLKPARAIPSKVLAVLGVNTEDFPSLKESSELTLFLEKEKKKPSSLDYDRMALMDLLLSARKYLLFSFSKKGLKEETSLSFLIKELLAYLDTSFLLNNEKPSQSLYFRHPVSSFDPSLFEINSPLKSFSYKNFKIATALEKEEKQELLSIFPHLHISKIPSLPESYTFSLQEIRSFLRSPLGSFIKKTEKLFLKGKEDEKNLLFPSLLEQSRLKKELFKAATLKKTALFQELLPSIEKDPFIPVEPFRQVLFSLLEKKVSHLLDNLLKEETPSFKNSLSLIEEWEIAYKSFSPFSRHFLPLSFFHEKGHFFISGKLTYASPFGFISLKSFSRQSLFEELFDWSIFNKIRLENNLPYSSDILFLEDGKKIAFPLKDLDGISHFLHNFFCFYFTALENPSPFSSVWAFSLLEKGEPYFLEQIQKQVEEENDFFFDPYFKFLFARKKDLENSFEMDEWLELGNKTFAPFLSLFLKESADEF